MISSALLLLVLSQNPLTMAARPFSFTGIDAALGAAWEDRFLTRIASPELKVTSSRDIEQVLGLERQRQLLGCDAASSSCLAELAGALGVELLLSASIVKSESGYLATVRVLGTRTGRPLATNSERVGTEAALLDWLDATALALRRQLVGELPTPPVVRWIPAFAGGAMWVGSTICLAVSGQRFQSLTGSVLPLGDIAGIRQEGELLAGLGIGLAVGGAVAVLSSVVWAALGRPAAPQAVEAVGLLTPAGGFLGVRGSFP
ncbi:MAG: hypothetical protein Q8L48_42095 [Archangium sp.]|nr:hypothetical protein [Archangium sp.]